MDYILYNVYLYLSMLYYTSFQDMSSPQQPLPCYHTLT